MALNVRKWAAALTAAALLLLLVAGATPTTEAANLTGGTYTYVINGEEATFPYDPVTRKGGLLLPVEVFQRFDVIVEGALSRRITLRKADVEVALTLGSTAITVDGRPDTTATAPLRLGGRLFLPADLLPHFGVEVEQDGTFIVMRRYVDGQPTLARITDDEFAALKQGRRFTRDVRADTGIYLSGEFLLLTDDLVAAPQMGFSYGTRARLQSLAESYTLMWVKLSNRSFKAGAFNAAGVYLVDDQRTQYDLIGTVDLGEGAVTQKLAPNADRTGVLLFPKPPSDRALLSVYYDPNGESIGSFHQVR